MGAVWDGREAVVGFGVFVGRERGFSINSIGGVIVRDIKEVNFNGEKVVVDGLGMILDILMGAVLTEYG